MPEAGGSHANALRRLIVTLVSVTSVLALPSPAFAGQFLDWGDGTDFHVFGPNEQVTIDTGSMNVVQNCPPGGADDIFFPFTAIFVVPSPFAGGTLADVSGAPNVVQGASDGSFTGETIGVTAPSGVLGPGDYAVVYDECQDDSFDQGVDFVVDPAIRVEIPSDVPPLPAITAFKGAAAAQALHWAFAHDYFEIVFKLGERWDESPAVYQKIVEDTRERAQQGALTALLNTALHYEGLAADPPDPNFRQITPLDTRDVLVTQSQDPLIVAGVQLGSDAVNESLIAKGLLASIERYQGADEVGNGEWALIHARAIREYADLLTAAIERTANSSASARAAFAADGGAFASLASSFEALRSQIATEGFSAEEYVALRNLGLTDFEIGLLRERFSNQAFTFDEADLLSRLSSIESNGSTLISELQTLSSDIGPVITTLEADPSVPDNAPVADAGGPYTGSEGTAITFDGSGSTSPTPITAHDWDLTADGSFGNGTGQSPSFVYQQAFTGFVGLRVTNSVGRSNIDYAPIDVVEVNERPQIASSSPANRAPSVVVGTSLTFSISASDPDGDPVTIFWAIEDNPVAAGASFTYTPVAGDVGTHNLRVVASDDNPLGGSAAVYWVVAVLLPDADGDGWRANVDCDESDAEINPGRTEVPGNGKDDDCNPATIDGPPAAPISLIPISTNFNNPVGIDYHHPTNQVVVSVNYSTGLPLNFELIAQDGSHAPFSSINGLTDEVKIATVRSGPCQGGFQVGELFTGTGVPGVIARIAPDGSSIANPWVTLPEEFGLMRGSLFQDRYCSFGGDLIVVTTEGGVWRITSAGQPTKLAQVSTHLEGVTTIPNDPATYGPWAGKILAGAESQRRLYAIAADGTFTPYELGIAPEDIDIVPSNENFFGVDFGAAEIKGAPASDFADKVGDVVIAQEFPGILWGVRWNAAVQAFEASEIARVSQWEHVTFAPAGINPLPPANSAPVAADDTVSTRVGANVNINVLANDSDPDGDSLTVTVVSDPPNGTATVDPDNTVTYDPDGCFVGTDIFTYTVSDGMGGTDTGLITARVRSTSRRIC